MPVNKEAFLRYRIIDRMFHNKSIPYPTMNDIIDELENKLGKSFSISTVQKDIKAMNIDLKQCKPPIYPANKVIKGAWLYPRGNLTAKPREG